MVNITYIWAINNGNLTLTHSEQSFKSYAPSGAHTSRNGYSNTTTVNLGQTTKQYNYLEVNCDHSTSHWAISQTNKWHQIGRANIPFHNKCWDSCWNLHEIQLNHSCLHHWNGTWSGGWQAISISPNIPAGFLAELRDNIYSNFRCSGDEYLVRHKLTIIWSNYTSRI
jgi:hypothetical protein